METCPSGCPKDSFGEGARLKVSIREVYEEW